MMKIALVSLEEGLSMNPPLGLAYLATYLEAKTGFKDTVIVDGSCEDIHKRLREIEPTLIGISSMSLRYGKSIRIAKEIRAYSNAQIVIGGVHISTMPQSFNNAFDFAILGEGEETFREVVEKFSTKGPLDKKDLSEIRGTLYLDDNGKITTTPMRPLLADIDNIPWPDMSYVHPRYFAPQEEIGLRMLAVKAPLLTARGCPYRCVFCSTTIFWKKYRAHSPQYVVNCVRYLHEKMGVRIINILDDLFIVNKKNIRELKKLMEQEGLLGKVTFTCTARSNLIDDEMCELLNSLHVKILNFGFESGSDRVLKHLKVGSTSVQKNKEAIRTCKKHGLVVYGSLMFGSPGESVEDMRQTLDFIDFAKKEKADYLWAFVATPFPQTEFWEEAKKRGHVSDDMDWERDDPMSHHNIDHPLLVDVDAEEFRLIFKKANQKLRNMRYRFILRFLFSNPLKIAAMFLNNLPYYVKRIYYYVFRF